MEFGVSRQAKHDGARVETVAQKQKQLSPGVTLTNPANTMTLIYSNWQPHYSIIILTEESCHKAAADRGRAHNAVWPSPERNSSLSLPPSSLFVSPRQINWQEDREDLMKESKIGQTSSTNQGVKEACGREIWREQVHLADAIVHELWYYQESRINVVLRGGGFRCLRTADNCERGKEPAGSVPHKGRKFLTRRATIILQYWYLLGLILSILIVYS